MKPSHIIARIQIIASDTYTALITKAKSDLGILEVSDPIPTPIDVSPVAPKHAYQVFCNGELIRQFDSAAEAIQYVRVQKVWMPDVRHQIEKV